MIVEVNVQLILAVNLLLVPISCLIHLLFGRCNWITNYFSKNSFRLTKTSVNWNYISFFCLFLFLHLFAFTKCFKLKKINKQKKTFYVSLSIPSFCTTLCCAQRWNTQGDIERFQLIRMKKVSDALRQKDQ